jgi:hypothetical protein
MFDDKINILGHSPHQKFVHIHMDKDAMEPGRTLLGECDLFVLICNGIGLISAVSVGLMKQGQTYLNDDIMLLRSRYL